MTEICTDGRIGVNLVRHNRTLFITDEKVRISPFRQRIGSAAVKAKLRDSQRSEFGSWRQPVGQFRRAAGVHVRFRLTRRRLQNIEIPSVRKRNTQQLLLACLATTAAIGPCRRGRSWSPAGISSAATPPRPRRPITTAARGKED